MKYRICEESRKPQNLQDISRRVMLFSFEQNTVKVGAMRTRIENRHQFHENVFFTNRKMGENSF